MKKIVLIPCLLSSHCAFAGTGGAEDENILILSFLAVIVSILVLLYATAFVRRRIAERKEKSVAQPADDVQSEDADEGVELKHPENSM
ncbi:MAG: hypothetical protein M5R41_16900 [Bacteroidia bacterium]|nr:hypothetical protein [Bacteroidia bacterium]